MRSNKDDCLDRNNTMKVRHPGYRLLPMLCFGINREALFLSVIDEPSGLSEFDVHSLLASPTVTIRDTYCRGTCRHQSAEECTLTTQLIFPYRGVYVRHVGQNQAVAEANQVLFLNAIEGYRVSHPVSGGDANITLVIEGSQPHTRLTIYFYIRRAKRGFEESSPC